MAEENFGDEWNEKPYDSPISPPIGTIKERYTDAIEEAKLAVRGSGASEIRDMHFQLMSDLEDIEQDAWEWVFTVGQVVSNRVIYCLAAISRLHELLKEKEDEKVQSQKENREKISEDGKVS